MLLSLKWLKEFVPYTGTLEELVHRLTMLGLEVDGVEHPFANISDLVVGKVLTCADHPESDHLHICTVDVGASAEGPLQIICGAPNVAAGQLVPVALVGCVMPDGLKIKKAKLRGVESCGMICSEREMGLSDEHSGILVLSDMGISPAPGTRVVDALNLDTEVLDVSITPNRADCLSVLGLAREVAMAFDLPLSLPAFELHEEGEARLIPIEIADPALCPSYTGRIIENAVTGPAPWRIRYRLHAVGQRPISNLVDVTNYILMELGQPLHAFDCDLLQGNRIIVSPAREGETITTLDGQARKLAPGDILIRDAARPVALGGVMGGLETEITPSTKSVFLECALFQTSAIRRTARRLGLNSEASYRYERGVDPTGMAYALDRAAALMALYSGGKVRRGVSAAIPLPWQAPQVTFRRHKAEDLLGVTLHEDFCRNTLEKLGCTVSGEFDAWQVLTPGWRYDLTREADLIEEIARVYGVDKIPDTLPNVVRTLDTFGTAPNRHHFLSQVRRWACGLGLNEAINYSFVGHKDLDFLGLPREGRVSITNPLTSEQDVLRTEVAAGLLQTLRHNLAQGNAGLHVFEVAQAFSADPASETTVAEQRRLGILLYGDNASESWPNKPADFDYPDLKGLVEHLCAHFVPGAAPDFALLPSHPFLAPAVSLTLCGTAIGVLGRVKPAMADAFHARKPVWLAELNLDALRELHLKSRILFQSLPVYPPVRRDLTLMAPASLKLDAIHAAIAACRSPLLADVTLIDIYTPVPATHNLTFRLTFRHAERTLQDAEVDKAREALVKHLCDTLPVRV